ncbi:MAG: cyclic nucleotide-binding domain-containing protein [Pseudomonadales bacterium]|nr:cyclic nucleotide-binding domain-containing protein [Pseudomonadales bacterium]
METTDSDLIKVRVPFSSMDEKTLKTVFSKLRIVKYPAGKMVFKRAEQDTNVYWLLEGALDLLDEKFDARNRKAADDASRYPIDNNSPHRFTAVTTEDSRILVAPRGELGMTSNSDGSVDFAINEVDEAEEGIDWMSTLLSSPLFEFIPPANIQTLFSKFEEVHYEQGEAVIRQGETGDYFYVIQAGRAKVERTGGDKTVLLAELRAGDNFGQDALVSDVPRNATVTMITTGTLMRLSAPDFQSLLMHPVIEKVTREEAQEMIDQADPKTYIIDVRTPKELESGKLPGSLNVPLLLLRKNLPKLRQDAIYVTSCDNGKRSTLAAYILNENGFTAYVLNNE